MYMKKIKTLIVDDHPAMIEGYKSILGYTSHAFEYSTAYNCESAYLAIINSRECFELAIIDINIPPYEAKSFESGIDVAIFFRRFSPSTKIVIITSHEEGFVIYSAVKKALPQGVLIKSDFSTHELILAIEAIISGDSYFSSSVKHYVREIGERINYLDTYNRQIISLLSKGVKTKNLPYHLNLSLSAIDKRKVQIKDLLGIQKGSDEEILDAAKKLGFI